MDGSLLLSSRQSILNSNIENCKHGSLLLSSRQSIEVYTYDLEKSIEVRCVLDPNWMLDWFDVGIVNKINVELCKLTEVLLLSFRIHVSYIILI